MTTLEYDMDAIQTSPSSVAANNHQEALNATSQILHTITQLVPERLRKTAVPATPKVHQYPNKHFAFKTSLNTLFPIRTILIKKEWKRCNGQIYLVLYLQFLSDRCWLLCETELKKRISQDIENPAMKFSVYVFVVLSACFYRTYEIVHYMEYGNYMYREVWTVSNH